MNEKDITENQLKYIRKKIGDKYNFSHLTCKQGINLITLINNNNHYSYLIHRRYDIDAHLKDIEDRINYIRYDNFKERSNNLDNFTTYKYAGLARVVGCKKMYPYFEYRYSYENDFWGCSNTFRLYWLGDDYFTSDPIELLIDNNILSLEDLLKKYDTELKEMRK